MAHTKESPSTITDDSSETTWKSLIHLMSVGTTPHMITTTSGQLLDCNDSAVEFFDLDRSVSLGQLLSDLELFSRQDTLEVQREAAERGVFEVDSIELTELAGGPRTVHIGVVAFDDGDRRLLLWCITERRSANRPTPSIAEEEGNPSMRLEAVGRLAGSIAASFNNLLSPIIGLAEMGLLETSPGDAQYSDFEQIRDAAIQANELSRQLLVFGRKQRLKLQELSLNDVINQSERLLRRLIREDIDIEIRLHPALGPVRGDPSQLQQILMNLVLNARDAMPHGGMMTIETSNIVVNRDQVQGEQGVEPGPFVMLSVTDSGYGMDDETQSRVFEPFFTTKGQGQGMGLSTTYGIVKQHGGMIWVYSQPGQGATLKVCLPRYVADGKAREEKPTPMPTSGPRGTETILVVEDEDIVRRMVCRILQTHGYEVIAAASGAEALALVGDSDREFDLLLTDVIMPQMNGKELRDRIRELRPATKALYMSGYADSVIARHGVLDDDAGFIQKPFSLWDLTKKVREALDR